MESAFGTNMTLLDPVPGDCYAKEEEGKGKEKGVSEGVKENTFFDVWYVEQQSWR